jgi:hypothetical protein
LRQSLIIFILSLDTPKENQNKGKNKIYLFTEEAQYIITGDDKDIIPK